MAEDDGRPIQVLRVWWWAILLPVIGTLLIVPLALISDAWWAWALCFVGIALGVVGLTLHIRDERR